ncbi:MAG TPA: alpha/beta hydrolase [Sphingobium sp.]|jgi:acetyl esterase/lipase|uniref:alpha/beta hydrolase n=1 Tax=unclassified Sphingobium TaxID=2611147 RepID=UPI0007F419FE|nr:MULTISPECIES: alpha/beta hydrolase [unclassified Sphingobium]OAN56619.1 esterase [Sphingobium sp. TCM1]WIW90653.1 alpha/beta hydrolase [Sphingobium sp. V4]HAF42818.1 alpha/beta hydrolase [Sphingobium sp.]
MKRLLAVIALAAAGPAIAQDVRMESIAAPDHKDAIDLYPGTPAPAGAGEQWSRMQVTLGSNRIDNIMVRNVIRPTITPYLPAPGKATGAAVIVAPGGAFLSLSMTGEGSDVARWLADHGVAAFVLKYRLNETPRDDRAFLGVMGARFGAAAKGDVVEEIREPRATQDALAALALVRARSAAFQVDPARVGMIGFSAGAMATLRAVLDGRGAARPAFMGYIYGPMAPLSVPADAPPMFAAIAMDDGLFARQNFGLVEAWRQAKRPVELHAYERGDHGFGAGKPGTTTMGLLPQFLSWMNMRGLLGAKAAQ